MIGFVDLHLHTTASDGTLTPVETVAAAISAGLCAISITDHDSVDGVAPAREAAGDALKVLPGVEISTVVGQSEVHILGYMLDCADQRLLDVLNLTREARARRAREMVERLYSLGLRVDYDQIEALAGGGTLGRPHIARALVSEGYVNSQAEAFRRFLRRGGPAYVERLRMSPGQAIGTIHDAGGAAVLAHPGLVREKRVVDGVLELGIDGIEAYHVDHTDAATESSLRVADERGLLVTGGSDSHGPGGSVPVKIGCVVVPERCAHELILWAERRDRHLEAGG